MQWEKGGVVYWFYDNRFEEINITSEVISLVYN